MKSMAARPLNLSRDPMMIFDGLCFAICRAASFPRPAFPKLRLKCGGRARNGQNTSCDEDDLPGKIKDICFWVE